MNVTPHKPSSAFVLASWAALFAGAIAYLVGLWNAGMPLSEKGYYFTVLMYGLFAAVSLQKSVRDQLEGIPVTPIYMHDMATGEFLGWPARSGPGGASARLTLRLALGGEACARVVGSMSPSPWSGPYTVQLCEGRCSPTLYLPLVRR